MVPFVWRFAPGWLENPQIFCGLKRHSDEDHRCLDIDALLWRYPAVNQSSLNNPLI